VLTRFAPAPTGWLHLGHVLNAEYVWGAIAPGSPKLEQRSGSVAPELHERRRVLLRIEDHDRERCRPEYEAGILADLDWLGYVPDLPVVRQSDRDAVYHGAVDVLLSCGVVYACSCTRKEIEDRTSNLRPPAVSLQPPASELVYDGYCRDRGLPLTAGAGWRVRMDPGVEAFDDLQLGPQAQDPSQQCGDVLIRDRLGNWTYQFAVSVDDFDQGIDLVIRGEDLLASTGRQIRLARLLGRAVPAKFMHHRLLMKSPSQKLSKSDGDTGIRDLRAQGWTPAEVKAAARGSGL
jgi:glutamyl-Q tRNA(Asp) synthetase